MAELIVFVDEHGRPTGETGPKLDSHNANTKLHLAFSSYVFNDQGQFLVTQRALSKKVWPGVWTNSCCGHPGPGEAMLDAIARRLKFELGLTADDIELAVPDYIYQTPPFNGIIEHEFCPIYVTRDTSRPQPNPDEVENFRWMSWEDYGAALVADEGNKWSWWCKDQFRLLQHHPLIREAVSR